MQSENITKFIGLIIQPNSFNLPQGALERAENVVVKYDNLIDKRRGFNEYHKFTTINTTNNLFNFDNVNFVVSATKLFQFYDTPYTATCYCYASSTLITINKRNHGLTNLSYIAEFNLPDSDPVTAEFPSRQSAFYGIQQINFAYTVTASRLTNVVTATLNNHGLNNGDTITITNAGTLSVALGSKTVTVLTANTFTFADTGLDASGNFIFENPHAFSFNAAQTAVAGASSVASAATFRYYLQQSGIAFSTTTVSKTRFVATDYAGYITTDQGLLKLPSSTSALYRAGIPPALDSTLQLDKNSSSYAIGPCEGNKQISYRVVFARKDVNNIITLGAPGSQTTIANPSVYTASLSVNAGTHVVTVTSTAHGLASTDKIYIYSASCTGGTISDGTEFFITKTGADTFTFDLDDQGLGAITAIANLNYAYDMSVRVITSIPSELDTNYMIQIFRTNNSVDINTTPDPRYFKIYEAALTNTDISRTFYSFYDEQPLITLSGTEELYTNYTLEGESQASHRPPRAKDIALFKGYLFYFNFETLHSLELNLVNPGVITNNALLTVAGSIYKFVNNTGNEYLGNQISTCVVSTSGTTATVTAPNAFTAGDIIYVIRCTTVNITEGLYTVATAGAANFTFATTAAATTGAITFEGRTDSTGRYLIRLMLASSTLSQAEAIDANARAIIRAINRNSSSTVAAYYGSLLDFRPGVINISNKYIENIAFTVTLSSGGAAFVPELPTSGTTVTSEQAVAEGELMFSKYGEPEAVPLLNRLPVGSKNYEGFRIAALRDSIIFIKQDGIFRLNGDAPSNFSVTILDNTTLCKSKESVAILNNSVYMLSNRGVVSITDASVSVLSRAIEPLFSSIVGYNYIEQVTSGVSYESERLYLLSTVKPVTALNTTLQPSDVVYAYNYLTNSWTTWNYPFSKGYNNQVEDKLFLISNNGEMIYKERKQQSRLDYGDIQYAAPLRRFLICEIITKTSSTEVEITSLFPHNLEAGDLITIKYANSALAAIFGGSISNLEGLRFVTGILSEYTFTFDADVIASGLVISDLYFNIGSCEADCSIALLAGVKYATITTTKPHGLNAGDNIYIEDADTAILALISNEYYLKGTRTILSTPTTTSFIIILGAAPTGTLTGGVVVTDNTQDFQYCTALVKASVQPQIGDMFYSAPLIYRIVEVAKFDTTHYCIRMGNSIRNISDTISYMYETFTATIKFTPIHSGDLGTSKKWTEFHASFRNSDACSGCRLIFGTDSLLASTAIDWDARVGTDDQTISFNKWGHSTWGRFAWNQGITIARQYTSAPSIHVRTYLPRECILGTFIQPQIIHNVAGEPFSLQSITLSTNRATNRSTR